jgi:hypothetical protein
MPTSSRGCEFATPAVLFTFAQVSTELLSVLQASCCCLLEVPMMACCASGGWQQHRTWYICLRLQQQHTPASNDSAQNSCKGVCQQAVYDIMQQPQ